MFSGGDDGAQTPQDSAAMINPIASTDNSVALPDPVQPMVAPSTDTGLPPEAAGIPVVAPPTQAPTGYGAVPTVSGAPDSGDLLGLKQQALQQLSPLLGQLDQPPEERFRTTMMMIQASDDSSLLKTAYDIAQQIPSDKARAQALLDVVNEINYFTHHEGESEPAAA